MSGTPYTPGTPYSPAQLGVRPAPALVQKLLVGAFGWMFAGLLLSAGVAYLVGSSEELLAAVLNWWLPIVIVQLVLGIGIQVAINKVSPTVSLGLFFVYAASMGLTIGVIVWTVMQDPGGTQAVASAFFSAAGMFGAAAVFGAVTKREPVQPGRDPVHGPDRDHRRVGHQHLPELRRAELGDLDPRRGAVHGAHRVRRPADHPRRLRGDDRARWSGPRSSRRSTCT